MRGYFGIGVERISKPANAGALLRTAHGFGASFLFTIGSPLGTSRMRGVDTSESWKHVPLYTFPDVESFELPKGCQLIGVELLEEATELPSFRHPRRAAYVLGPERGQLSRELRERCDHLVKIPTRFALNVGLAGALVMYDRVLTLGRFPPRPVRPGAPTEELEPHVFGDPVFRREGRRDRADDRAEAEEGEGEP